MSSRPAKRVYAWRLAEVNFIVMKSYIFIRIKNVF